MAGHSKIKENHIMKAFLMKVKETRKNQWQSNFIRSEIAKFTNYYNGLSKFIADRLLDDMVTTLAPLIEEKKRDSEYYKYLTNGDWDGKPLYFIFKEGFNSTNADNILANSLVRVYCEQNYTGNGFGLSYSYYVVIGFAKEVIANYRSSFQKPKVKIKKKKLSENPTEDELIEQCIYTIYYEFNEKKDIKKWKDEIKFLKERGESKETRLKRIQTLFEFYKDKNHKELVDERVANLVVDNIKEFGGCKRDIGCPSMGIQIQHNFDISINEKRNGYTICFGPNKKNLTKLEVFGNRMVLLNGEEIVDLPNTHGEKLTLIDRGNAIYAALTAQVPFEKHMPDGNKTVGIDLNLKHSVFATSIVDNGKLAGYISIYKELLKDDEFVKYCPKDLLRFMKDASKYVFFAPIEIELLRSRVIYNKGYACVENYENVYKAEVAFVNVIKRLQSQCEANGDAQGALYMSYLSKMRAQLKNYINLKLAYYDHQSAYDLKMGFNDISAESKETIDERRKLFPFSKEKEAQEILAKMKNISNVIIACRNNIAVYMYKMFERNGYDFIGLEKLESSQMKKRQSRSFPTVKSLLNYHKLAGMTMDEIKKQEVSSNIKKGFYDLEFDADGKLYGAKYSNKGNVHFIEDEFYISGLKAIHFADMKDYFVRLSNNGKVSVALVPPSFTSQMDSVEHKFFMKKNANGKLIVADKKDVRSCQEKHKINGLNADYNAACNIGFIVEDDYMRESLLGSPTGGTYDTAYFDTKIQGSKGVYDKIKENGETYIAVLSDDVITAEE